MMNAKYYYVGDLMVVEVTGRIDADQNKPFRDICQKQLADKKVIFCLDKLSFTASANLGTFFESINLIPNARVVGLKSDFHRLLELKGFTTLKHFATLSDALRNLDF
jgi:anti-anti-sigma factor